MILYFSPSLLIFFSSEDCLNIYIYLIENFIKKGNFQQDLIDLTTHILLKVYMYVILEDLQTSSSLSKHCSELESFSESNIFHTQSSLQQSPKSKDIILWSLKVNMTQQQQQRLPDLFLCQYMHFHCLMVTLSLESYQVEMQ